MTIITLMYIIHTGHVITLSQTYFDYDHHNHNIIRVISLTIITTLMSIVVNTHVDDHCDYGQSPRHTTLISLMLFVVRHCGVVT